MHITSDVAREMLNVSMEEAHRQKGAGFREICQGLEIGCVALARDYGVLVTKLGLGFSHDGESTVATVDEVEVAERGELPDDWAAEGLWAVFYAMATPRYSPFGKDPLRIARLVVGYGINPVVEYDRTQANGLPLALDSAYDPKILMPAGDAQNQSKDMSTWAGLSAPGGARQ